MTLEFRGLELHGRRMWERARIVEAFEFIRRHGMTALVLHETDLIQQVVFPRAYFDPYALWKDAPTRRGENAIQNNRAYLDHILNLARRYGVDVWVEVKELGFPDEVLELHPELLVEGRVCPSAPFWVEFTEHKTAELFDDFPLLAGMITSAGSPEGRASLAQRKCRCARCRDTAVEDWYRSLIMALYRPLSARGKRLAVRDFAYKPADHEPLIRAMERVPEDIVFCIKNTPHDFYPTFPHNPAIGRLRRTQWVEYDVYGQFYGMGVVPCFVYDDLRARLAHAVRHGVTGGLFRVEWERVNDWWCLETLNEVNLILAAALARGDDPTPEEVCRLWLEGRSMRVDGAAWLAEILMETWPVIRGALYVDGFLFADSSFLPRSVQRAWWTMETKHSLWAWDPSRRHDLELSRERVEALIAEKEEARRRVRRLAGRVEAGHPSADPRLLETLRAQFDLFETYVEGFYHCARVCLFARWVETRPGEVKDADRARFREALEALASYGTRVRALAEEARHPHQVTLLMDHRRVADVLAEGRQALGA